MRYVFYVFAIAGMVMVWANTSDKGRSMKRQLTSHPADSNWSN